jgi:PAS domain S-box-containing protein
MLQQMEVKAGAPHGIVHRIERWLEWPIMRFVLPPVTAGAALLIHTWLQRALGTEAPYLFYWPALAISAWYGGLWCGLATMALAGVSVLCLSYKPAEFFSLARPDEMVSMTLFLFLGTCLCFLIGKAHGASRRLEQYTRELLDQRDVLRKQADLLELANDAVFVRNGADRITYWNRAAEGRYGWSRDEALGRHTHTFLQTIFPQPLEEIEAILRRQGRWEGELKHTTRDGTRITVASRWSLQRDEEGNALGVLEINNDITARKIMEEEIGRAGAYNRSLIEASLDPLVTIGAGGKITDVNSATEKATGRPRQELVGTDFADYFTEPDRARQGYQQVFREGFVRDYPLEIRHREGHLTPVLYNASVYRDDAGQVMGVFAAARDITERKRAEEALRRASAYNRSLLEASLDPLVTIGAGGKITDVNSATERVTGRTRQELIGTDFADYFTEPDKARQGYQQAFREGFVRDYPLELRHKEGSLTPVLYNASVYRDEAGRVQGVFAAARDIHELLGQREILRKQAELLELAHDAIFVHDPGDRLTYWNRAAEEMYGWSRDEALGQYTHAFLKTTFPAPFQEIEETLHRQGHWEGVLQHVTRDGRQITLDSRWSLQKDDEGNPVGLLEINSDITTRKLLEEEIRRAGAYNRSLIEASLDPLVTIGSDGKITDVNSATERATGRTRQDLVGTDFADYFTEPEKARQGYEQVFREGFVRDYPLEIREPNAHTIPVLYNASIYRDEAGQVQGVFAAARDISERRRMEAVLAQRAEALERSNRELEQFAYVASHDLQEPLRMVASYVELLARRYQGHIDDKADKYIHYIVDGATRMQTLINDLLTFSRVATRAKPFTCTSAENALAEVLGNLERSIADKQATVTHDPLPEVVVDPTQFEQVMQNLVGNGIKFCEQKPQVHVSAVGRGDFWEFSVRDNGIGIAPEHRERLFVLFQRLHTRQAYPGTGIGLAVCKKIVERHGGRIWVESKPGQGSTFYFTIPAREEPPS